MNELQKAYLLLQENCGIKVGDTVRVLRKAEDHENGWNNAWTASMGKSISKESTVTHVDEGGIELHINGYRYPFFVIEKLTLDWTEKLCEEVPAICRVGDDERLNKMALVKCKDDNPNYPFDTTEEGAYAHAELVPKELLQAMIERYYD